MSDEHDITSEGTLVADPAAAAEGRDGIDDGPVRTDAEIRRSEKLVVRVFGLAALLAVGFVVAYVFADFRDADEGQLWNVLLGLSLGGALLAVGVGGVLWQKLLMPTDKVVEERKPFTPTDEEWADMSGTFLENSAGTGVPRRKLLLGSLVGATGMLAVPAVVMLRDLGPAGSEGQPAEAFAHTHWAESVANGHARLRDKVTGRLVTVDTLEPGGIVGTVLPEDVTEEDTEFHDYMHIIADSAVVLLRLREGENKPLPGREDWSPEGYVAYSKVCTHVGCPVALYEQQTNRLLCPCHQSTFDAADGARVIFGPAGRPLPQLPLGIDEEGYLYARSDFVEPVGPSYWERDGRYLDREGDPAREGTEA